MIETQQMRPRPLEPRLYLDPEVLAEEIDAIFARTWQYAGHVSQLPSPGSYLTTTAGDQPVLVLRTQDGELRAFRNVCRHRGSELLSGTGTCKRAIRCRYHGWTYDSSDGQLLGVPEHRSYGDLDKGALGLFPARVESFGGLIFVNLDPLATPLAEQAAGTRCRCSSATGSRISSASPRVTAAANRPTGRSSPTTTSRATTCRSPIRG